MKLGCREPLLRENPRAAETMDMEQTWPTQEEMEGGAGDPPQRRLAPGTSDYQACWILDDDEDAADEDGDAEDTTQNIAEPTGPPPPPFTCLRSQSATLVASGDSFL